MSNTVMDLYLNAKKSSASRTNGKTMTANIQRTQAYIGKSIFDVDGRSSFQIDSFTLWASTAMNQAQVTRLISSHIQVPDIHEITWSQGSPDLPLSTKLAMPLDSSETLNPAQLVRYNTNLTLIQSQINSVTYNISQSVGGVNYTLPITEPWRSASLLQIVTYTTSCAASIAQPEVVLQFDSKTCIQRGITNYCPSDEYCRLITPQQPVCLCPQWLTGERCEIQRSCSNFTCHNSGTCSQSGSYTNPLFNNGPTSHAQCSCRCSWRGADCSQTSHRRCCVDQAGKCASAGADAKYESIFKCWTEYGNCNEFMPHLPAPRPDTTTIQFCDAQFGQHIEFVAEISDVGFLDVDAAAAAAAAVDCDFHLVLDQCVSRFLNSN